MHSPIVVSEDGQQTARWDYRVLPFFHAYDYSIRFGVWTKDQVIGGLLQGDFEEAEDIFAACVDEDNVLDLIRAELY